MQLARIDAVDSLATAVLAHLLTVAETFKRHTPKVKGRRKGPAWEERPAPPAPDVWASICKRGGINGHALSIVRQAGSGVPVSAACAKLPAQGYDLGVHPQSGLLTMPEAGRTPQATRAGLPGCMAAVSAG